MFLKIISLFLAGLALLIPLNPLPVFRPSMRLSNPDADGSAVKLYEYICSIYGKSVLSGQQEGFGSPARNDEFDYIYSASGKYPAVRGFDFVNDDFEGVYTRASEWWEKGGIVTICWHCGSNFELGYSECLADGFENPELLLTEGTPENAAFVRNMDRAGEVLGRLRDKGIPVLWRPFHEFNGEWFWWGKDRDGFIKLWRYMYNHFTKDLGLNNLIWVLGYSERDVELRDYFMWYPGNGYCDIVGCDSYDTEKDGAEPSQFEKCVRVSFGTKPVIFHECGHIPDSEQFAGTPWCGFLTWHSQYLYERNSPEYIREIYNSENVITLDELPVFEGR